MDLGMAGDGLSWYYLDSTRKEFGPFPNDMMRDWFVQGFFPAGEELLIRLPQWKQHVPIRLVYPDVGMAFVGLPRGEPTPQVEHFGGFQDQPPAYMPDLRRQEEPPPYPSPAQFGGYYMMQPGGGCGPGSNPGMYPNPMAGLHSGLGGMPPSSHLAPMMPNPGMPLPGIPGMPGMPGGMGAGMLGGGFRGAAPLPQRQFGMPQGVPTGRFRGRIKSFNAKQGFGFIENSEAHAFFGRDVFLHKAQIGDLKVGTEVTYSVEMNKQGMPQARDLVTLDGLAPGPMPPNVAKGGGTGRGKTPVSGMTDRASGMGRGRGRGGQARPPVSTLTPGVVPSSMIPNQDFTGAGMGLSVGAR